MHNDSSNGLLSRIPTVFGVTLWLVLGYVCTTLPAAADEETKSGALTYQVYCQSCHGSEARGDGPVAPYLKIPPPDLTRLAERAGGEFPAMQVRRKIDGRDPVPSHGPSDMPVWGLTFELRGEANPDHVDRRIEELVELLRSLQERQAAAKGDDR